MASVNKVILVGNLGADPEMRPLASGEQVANLRLATTERYKDKNTGEIKELTEWHRVVFFGRSAEVCGQYLKKGAPIYAEGRIRTRKWQDASGQDRYSTEIVGDQMQMLGSKNSQYGTDNETMTGSNNNFRQTASTMPQTLGSALAPVMANFNPAFESSHSNIEDDVPF